MNNTISDKINDIIAETINIRKIAEKNLKESPGGALEATNERGVIRYYQVGADPHAYEKYLGKHDIETIRALERKFYNLTLLNAAEKELRGLHEILDILEGLPDCNSVFLTIPREKRHLIEPVGLNDNSIISDFSYSKTTKKQRRVDSLFITKKGERVRSKSELIIADRLNDSGVPYLYEYPVTIENEETGLPTCWYPDFKVLNKRTGRQYYWEHFGMMDSSEYCATCQYKLEKFAENGYYPGANLIISIESSQRSLSTKYVDLLIENYLL